MKGCLKKSLKNRKECSFLPTIKPGGRQMELVGKQDDDQITSYRLISHVVRQVHSSGVLSRQSRHESPQIW